MKYHLAHIVPHETAHGLHGYKDVIDTIYWGLEQLGHSVSYGLNRLDSTSRNIVFGAHMLDPKMLRELPTDTIAYNFEQSRNIAPEELRPEMRIIAERFEIWDYSVANMPTWDKLGALRAEVVPIGFAPVLQRISKPVDQDIDVLIYGMPGEGRISAFYYLCEAGMTAMFFCGLYGKARDELISRSKVVLNINLYSTTKIFEIIRCSYLMANRKAVIADVDADTFIEDDILKGIKVTKPEQLVATCQELVTNASERLRIENEGFETIAKRDIRAILAEVID